MVLLYAGKRLTIFIIVTHIVLLEARRIDSFFCYADFLPLCKSERTRRVNSGFADTETVLDTIVMACIIEFSHERNSGI